VTGLSLAHCHCRDHVGRLCRHHARHCYRGDHHQDDHQGRRDEDRHQDDHQGYQDAGRRVRQPGAGVRRRVVARRDAHRRHHWDHQPGGQWCQRGDAMRRRQRDVAMRAKKTMSMKCENEK
jgi:hypothetical protein